MEALLRDLRLAARSLTRDRAYPALTLRAESRPPAIRR
jgi:hypothetical protein